MPNKNLPKLNRFEERFKNTSNISISIIDCINDAKRPLESFNDMYDFASSGNCFNNPERLLGHASSLMYAFLRDLEYISDLAFQVQIKNEVPS